MIRKEVNCPDCGAVVVAEFKTQYGADHCYKRLCKKCVAKHQLESNRRSKQKYRQTHYTERSLANDQINKACNRFFEKRHMKIEEIRPMPIMHEDTSKAVSYGEMAAKRYMRGKKDG